MMEITYIPKKKTTTLFIGSDGKEYKECPQCKKNKIITYFLSKETCPVCKAKKDAILLEKKKEQAQKALIRLEKQLKKEAEKQHRREVFELKKKVRFTFLWKHYQLLIDTIKDFIRVGYSNEIIMAIFFGERNAPYDLSNAKKSYLIQIPSFGNTLEHINGRECIGYYCVYAILVGDIKNPEELEQFYLKYCGQIRTDADFNNKVIKPYQNDEGAISPETYMEVLERERSVKLSPDEKEYFRSKFLYSEYGKIFKDDVINYVRNNA